MKHVIAVLGILGALSASAYVSVPLGPVKSDRPVKVVAVEAASTNLAATIVLKRIADLSLDSASFVPTVVTNGWAGDVPVLATNVAFRAVRVPRFVTNTVLNARCSSGFLSTNLTFYAVEGDRFLASGAERVVLIGE